jgi:hypothetical protein
VNRPICVVDGLRVAHDEGLRFLVRVVPVFVIAMTNPADGIGALAGAQGLVPSPAWPPLPIM